MNFKKEKSVSDYRVLPRTVLCDTPARVSIIPCGKSKRFDDQTDYTVSLVPMSFYSDSYVDGSMKPETLTVRPVDGTLTVPCRLADEQEWVLSVDWEENRKRGRQPLEFHIYALREDLYRRNPYRGDLHSHSTGSDGREGPAVVAANYRREGFDFLALTDHSNWHSSEQMLQAYGDLPLGIRLFHGEEVHLGTIIHIVNFGSRYSITDHYRSNQEQCQAEMRELADRHPTPQGVNRQEYAMRLWIVEQIRRAGGMAIVPHPYWIHKPGIFNMNTRMLDYVFEQGAFDAFELTGGQTVHENNLQLAFYQEQRAMGRKIPIVGSSDSHGTDPASYFNMSKTVLFAPDCSFDSVCAAVRDGYSVAVEEPYGEEARVHGPYRLVAYTRFLLNYYFPIHDELCVEEGRLMREFACGSEGAGQQLRECAGRVAARAARILRGED